MTFLRKSVGVGIPCKVEKRKPCRERESSALC